MSEKATHIILYINMAIIMFGSGLFIYWYYIDELITPPLEFFVDIENFETNKDVYNQQETVQLKTSFCKHRTSEGSTSWNLIDTFVRAYPAKTGQFKAGCYGLENGVWIDVAKLPPDLPAGEYYFDAVGYVQINPIKKVKYYYKTQKFNVI